jgi:hypothetical protein
MRGAKRGFSEATKLSFIYRDCLSSVLLNALHLNWIFNS